MKKLKTLLGTNTIIGQLYCFGKPTNEVMAIQFGAAIGLNCNRHWNDVSVAGAEFEIEPISIKLCGVKEIKEVDIDIPAKYY